MVWADLGQSGSNNQGFPFPKYSELTPTSTTEDFLFFKVRYFWLTLVGEPSAWLERFWTEISLEGAAVLGLLLLSPCRQNHHWFSYSLSFIFFFALNLNFPSSCMQDPASTAVHLSDIRINASNALITQRASSSPIIVKLGPKICNA